MICENCKNDILLPAHKGFFSCPSCRAPQFYGKLDFPFDVLGLDPQYEINPQAIEERYLLLTKRLHPDHLALKFPNLKSQTQAWSAALNKALKTLTENEARLESLMHYMAAFISTKTYQPQKNALIPQELSEAFFEIQELQLEGHVVAALNSAQELQHEIEAEEARLNEENLPFLKQLNSSLLKVQSAKPDTEKLQIVYEQLSKFQQQKSYLNSLKHNLSNLTKELHGIS